MALFVTQLFRKVVGVLVSLGRARVAQALEGMPVPEPLRLHTYQGESVVLSGKWVLFRFDAADAGMRTLATDR